RYGGDVGGTPLDGCLVSGAQGPGAHAVRGGGLRGAPRRSPGDSRRYQGCPRHLKKLGRAVPDGVPSNAVSPLTAERLSIAGVDLEVVRRGAGHPVLLLHGLQNIPPEARVPYRRGRHAETAAPPHPGFGSSSRPADFETVYDLVHLYLALLDSLPHEKVTVIGLSVGRCLA